MSTRPAYTSRKHDAFLAETCEKPNNCAKHIGLFDIPREVTVYFKRRLRPQAWGTRGATATRDNTRRVNDLFGRGEAGIRKGFVIRKGLAMACSCLLLTVWALAGCDVPVNTSGASTTHTLFPETLDTSLVIREGTWLTERRAGTDQYAEVTPTRSYAPFPVFFEGWRTNPRDAIIQYEWNFGDGSPLFHGFNAAHVYETPGIYTATLTVRDRFDQESTRETLIEVLARDGVAYYVDAISGNDANAGTSPGTAWQTAHRAFSGMTNASYGPGDQILFARGQAFTIQPDTIDLNHWQTGYGYMFGAYGSGANPVIKTEGSTSGTLILNQAAGLAHVSFVDLDFDLTSDLGAVSTLYFGTTQTEHLMFLRCNISNFNQGILLSGASDDSGEIGGSFIVDCNMYNSAVVHVYSVSSRLSLLNNTFDLSGNHLAYLLMVDAGVVSGNHFSRPPFGRHALRLAGTAGPHVTNNVCITDNTFQGWIDPLSDGRAHNGGGTRYNISLVHLGPSDPETQIMQDVVFKNNVLRDAETLLNIGTHENLIVRDNVFSTVDTSENSPILIGSTFDLRPVRSLIFTRNTISMPTSTEAGAHRAVFRVAAPNGLVHQNLIFDQNVLLLDGVHSKVIAIENGSVTQWSEVNTNNLVVFNSDETALYQLGGDWRNSTGTDYSLTDWRSFSDHDLGTQVYTSNSTPIPGWALSPPSATSFPIRVRFDGTVDNSGAGLGEVQLWVRVDGGSWQDTGLRSFGTSGSFDYTDGSAPSVTTPYDFALRAVDNAANASPVPTGGGHSTTLYVP